MLLAIPGTTGVVLHRGSSLSEDVDEYNEQLQEAAQIVVLGAFRFLRRFCDGFFGLGSSCFGAVGIRRWRRVFQTRT